MSRAPPRGRARARPRRPAADRLADGDDRLARDRLGFGQAHGDLGHGLGDETQLLRAPGDVGEHIEEDDGHEEHGGEHDEHRRAQAGRAERRLHLRHVHPAEHEARQHPQPGKNRRGEVGRACRAALQRPQDLADRFTIVIGGAARQARLFCLARLGVERGGFDGAPLRSRLLGRGHRRSGRSLRLRHRGIARGECVLDRRKRRFGRILDLGRSVCHVRRRLVLRWTRAAAGPDPDRATSALA
jgi:hypothetical protein